MVNSFRARVFASDYPPTSDSASQTVSLSERPSPQRVTSRSTLMGPAYFREAAEVINAAAGGPPDRAKMMDVFQRHGMTMAAPPPAK